MIAYIIGELVEVDENRVVLQAGHIGYQIFVPATVMQEVRLGEEIKVHTYLHVKEDAMQLYGFLTGDDLQMFKLLLGVNGIGPKAALAVLSAMSADELRFAVLAEDVAAISKTPGLGKKTAQKLILELKDKLSLEDAFEQKLQNRNRAGENFPAGQEPAAEAVQALVALGYSNSDAMRAVRKIESDATMNVEEILKAALKQM